MRNNPYSLKGEPGYQNGFTPVPNDVLYGMGIGYCEIGLLTVLNNAHRSGKDLYINDIASASNQGRAKTRNSWSKLMKLGFLRKSGKSWEFTINPNDFSNCAKFKLSSDCPVKSKPSKSHPGTVKCENRTFKSAKIELYESGDTASEQAKDFEDAKYRINMNKDLIKPRPTSPISEVDKNNPLPGCSPLLAEHQTNRSAEVDTAVVSTIKHQGEDVSFQGKQAPKQRKNVLSLDDYSAFSKLLALDKKPAACDKRRAKLAFAVALAEGITSAEILSAYRDYSIEMSASDPRFIKKLHLWIAAVDDERSLRAAVRAARRERKLHEQRLNPPLSPHAQEEIERQEQLMQLIAGNAELRVLDEQLGAATLAVRLALSSSGFRSPAYLEAKAHYDAIFDQRESAINTALIKDREKITEAYFDDLGSVTADEIIAQAQSILEAKDLSDALAAIRDVKTIKFSFSGNLTESEKLKIMINNLDIEIGEVRECFSPVDNRPVFVKRSA